MHLRTIFFFVQIIFLVKGFIIPNAIENFIETYKSSVVEIFICDVKTVEYKYLVKILLEKKIMTRINNINDVNNNKLIKDNFNKYNKINLILDGDCKNSDYILKECDSAKLFLEKYEWLIFASNKADIGLKLENVSSGNVQIVTPGAKRINNDDYGRKIRLMNRSIVKTALLSNNFNDESIVIDEPIGDEKYQIEKSNQLQARLFLFCKDYYNFLLNVTTVNDVNQLIGKLGRREIDLSLSGVEFSTDWLDVVDYGRKTHRLRSTFMLRNPKALTSFLVIFEPLSPKVWMITVAAIFVSVVLLKFITRYEIDKLEESDVDSSWSLMVVVAVGAFCQQGASRVPKLLSGKFIVLTVFVLAFILYQFYSGSIVSSLLMKTSNKIKDIEDLANHPIRVGCQDDGHIFDYFKFTRDKPARELYKKKIRGDRGSVYPVRDGMGLVSGGDFAYHVDEFVAFPKLRNFSENALCELRQIQMIRDRDIHAVYAKQSPYKNTLDVCLQCLAERGILSREISSWYPRKPACMQKSGTIEVGITEFYPMLVILVSGVALSIIIFIFEFIYSHGTKMTH